MDPWLIDLEVSEEAGEGGGTGAVADFTPAEPAAESFSPDELRGMVEQSIRGVFGELMAQAPEPAAAPAELPEFNPFEPATFDARASALFETVLDRKLGELGLDEIKHFAGIAAQEHADRVANDYLDRLKSEVGGDFDRDRARLIGFAYQSAGHQPAEALKLAATQDADYRRTILEEGKKLGRDELQAELKGLQAGGGPTEPSSGGGGAELRPDTPKGANRYMDTVKSSLERMRAEREAVG